MVDKISLCHCGDCNDAHAAALKVFKPMVDGHDCTMWNFAVAQHLLTMSRMAMAASFRRINDAKGIDVMATLDETRAAMENIYNLCCEVDATDAASRKAVADIVCAKHGETMREVIEMGPVTNREMALVDLLEKIFGKDSVFTADSLGITKPH